MDRAAILLKMQQDWDARARQEFRDKHLIGVVLNGVSTESAYTQYYYATYGRTNGRPESQG